MKEEDIIEILKKDNEEFSRIYNEHRKLDSQLAEFNKKPYLTPEEDLEMLKIKKEKLYKKDKLAELIKEYKRQHAIA